MEAHTEYLLVCGDGGYHHNLGGVPFTDPRVAADFARAIDNNGQWFCTPHVHAIKRSVITEDWKLVSLAELAGGEPA